MIDRSTKTQVSWNLKEKMCRELGRRNYSRHPEIFHFQKGNVSFFFLCDAHLPPAFKGIKKKGNAIIIA